jgi:hypothetical protein
VEMIVFPVKEQLQDPVQPRKLNVLPNLYAAPNQWLDIVQVDPKLVNCAAMFLAHLRHTIRARARQFSGSGERLLRPMWSAKVAPLRD